MNHQQQPKAILFDLLTGLLNSWSIWDTVIPTSERTVTDGQTWRKQYLHLAFSCGPYKPYEDLVRQAAVNVGLSQTCATALLDRYDEIGYNPWPEVPEVLARLKAKGYKLGVVTNISHELGLRTVRNVEGVVRERTGVKEFAFDAVVTAEEAGYYKPEQKPYWDGLRKLGVGAEEALFVAGSPSDIMGATRVGMRVVWNNHIGLARGDNALPLKEGKLLDEALEDFLH